MTRRRPRYSGTHPRAFHEKYKERAPEEFPEHTAHLREKGKTPASTHLPVMVSEVLEHLDPQPGATIVDCTLGYGGHARAILERINADPSKPGRLIGLDVDGAELPKTTARLQADFGDAVRTYRMRFAGIAKALALEGIEHVDGILADLGVSSMQLDDPSRGFSVKHDGPLDLRMDDRLKRTAADLVNTLPEAELATAFRDLADLPDREAAAIAREIWARRRNLPFTRTSELKNTIATAAGSKGAGDALGGARSVQRSSGDATGGAPSSVQGSARVFQALRMLVNDELGNLRELLRVAPLVLAPGHGRLVLLSFHSGEDRLVKESLKSGIRAGLYAEIADDPLRPKEEEVRSNARASSARLRFAVCSAREEEGGGHGV